MMRTSELIGPALDWAVAKCEGYVPITHSRLANVMVEREDLRGIMSPVHIHSLKYSTDWAQGGPIIEREHITVLSPANNGSWNWIADKGGVRGFSGGADRSPLIAAMRCYVASKLGDEVEIPEGSQ